MNRKKSVDKHTGNVLTLNHSWTNRIYMTICFYHTLTKKKRLIWSHWITLNHIEWTVSVCVSAIFSLFIYFVFLCYGFFLYKSNSHTTSRDCSAPRDCINICLKFQCFENQNKIKNEHPWLLYFSITIIILFLCPP